MRRTQRMKEKHRIHDCLLITPGCFILAAGTNTFLVPFRISSGGISTIGTILLYRLNIPLSVTNIVLNTALFALGLFFLGRASVARTVIGAVLFSVFLEITSHLPQYTEDIFISVCIGGALVGIGVGMVVKTGASTGGSDFAALMLKKAFPHISIANIILVIDCAVIAVSGIVFSSITVMFYSILAMYISSKTTDIVISIGDSAKSVCIVSPENDAISKIIMEKFERGTTGIYSRGMFSGSDSLMLMCIVRPKELPSLIKEIKIIDRDAFIIISEVREVLGEGFKTKKEY